MKRFQVYLGNDLSLVAQTSSVDTPQLVGQPRMTRFLDQVLGLLLVLALYELVVFDGVDALLILLSLQDNSTRVEVVEKSELKVVENGLLVDLIVECAGKVCNVTRIRVPKSSSFPFPTEYKRKNSNFG